MGSCPLASSLTHCFILESSKLSMDSYSLFGQRGIPLPFWGFGTRHFVFGRVLFFYFILPSFSSCKKGLDSPYLYGFVLFDWLSDFSLSAQPWLSGSFFGLRVFGLRTCFPV